MEKYTNNPFIRRVYRHVSITDGGDRLYREIQRYCIKLGNTRFLVTAGLDPIQPNRRCIIISQPCHVYPEASDKMGHNQQ